MTNFKVLRGRLLRAFHLPPELKFPFLLVYLVTALSFLVLLAVYSQLQPVVPLFYNQANLTSQLAAKHWLWIFPTLTLAISFSHTLIVKLIHDDAQLMARLFAWSTFIVQSLLFIELARIIYIVI